jgi:hypothetical protein
LTICNPAGFEDFIRAAAWNLSVAKPEDWVVDIQALIDAAARQPVKERLDLPSVWAMQCLGGISTTDTTAQQAS